MQSGSPQDEDADEQSQRVHESHHGEDRSVGSALSNSGDDSLEQKSPDAAAQHQQS